MKESCSAAPASSPFQSLLSWEISISNSSLALLLTGAAIGTLVTLLLVYLMMNRKRTAATAAAYSPALTQAEDCRRRLPQTIILVRHGESEANADKSMWIKRPDNMLGLTTKGHEQAAAAGQRVEKILQQQDDDCERVHLVVSPFERTLQTAASLRPALEHRIVRTDIESRIREQEVGNLQNEEFQKYRQEQKRVGRFFYRFPTGESGADVADRVKSWWYESVLTVNTRVGFEPVQAMVVVSHGLTMRYVLMQLFYWSPTTFHSVWNAGNCQMYVFQKDLSKPGPSPYVLDVERGDVPKSSIDVQVQLQSSGETKNLTLKDYLSIPPPRSTRTECIKHMLASQYPEEIQNGPDDIVSVMFLPFMEGGIVKGSSSSSSSVPPFKNAPSSLSTATSTTTFSSTTTIGDGTSALSSDVLRDSFESAPGQLLTTGQPSFRRAKLEQSLRWPCVYVPKDG